MNIKIKIINQISDSIEKYIIKKINKKAPYAFGPLLKSEINFIRSKVKSKYNLDIKSQIIWSIKSAYMKNYIIMTYYKLNKYKSELIDKYNRKNDILKLSKEYKLSPMTILRFILENKYNTKIKFLISDISKLDTFDKKQFDSAIKSDIYNQIEQSEQLIEAEEFEKKIEKILKNHNIKFKTQQELSIDQLKIYGKIINTPDFLIKSELIINNHKINWIDAKNFYGSNIDFVKKKIKKQIKKYLDTYGSGCIIFKYGFNSELKFDKTLILSIESINIL
jgi:hypothetical protein